MSESQSRYSIVERLTQEKLEIIEAKASLSLNITEVEERVARVKKQLEDWEKDIIKDNERTKRIKSRAIEEAETELKNATAQKGQKEATCEKKLEAVKEALDKLEAISKLAE